MSTKRVAFSTDIKIYTIPRIDDTRYGRWIDYCAETKKCNEYTEPYISRRYSYVVLCCGECRHVKEIIQ